MHVNISMPTNLLITQKILKKLIMIVYKEVSRMAAGKYSAASHLVLFVIWTGKIPSYF